MTQRTSAREKRMEVISAAKLLDEQIAAAMIDYPHLHGWRLQSAELAEPN